MKKTYMARAYFTMEVHNTADMVEAYKMAKAAMEGWVHEDLYDYLEYEVFEVDEAGLGESQPYPEPSNCDTFIGSDGMTYADVVGCSIHDPKEDDNVVG
jgi:hypothetical protein